jgi:hypothetical protein
MASRPSDVARVLATIDLDAGGINDNILDAIGQEESMEPEAVASGFVAGADLGVIGETEPHLGGPHFGQERNNVASLDIPQTGLLAQANGEGQLPGAPAQIQRKIKNRGRHEVRIRVVSRRHGKAPWKRGLFTTRSLTAATHVSNSLPSSLIVSDPAAAVTPRQP